MMNAVMASPKHGMVEDVFERQAPAVLRALRASVAAVIEALPGGESINRAADLQRALDIRNTLAWQVYRLAYAPDLLAEGSSVPGIAAMKRFLDAASERGVPEDLIREVGRSLEEFKAFVQTHAGDRSAFDSMISSLQGRSDNQVDLQHKRAAFKANSHIWGVRARTQLTCFVLQPSAEDSSRLDLLILRGLIGLKRLRRNASWVVSRARVADDDGQVRHAYSQRPIDPLDADSPSVALLRQFCSQPLPRFRSVPSESGFTNVELEPTNVGNMSAITCMIGEVYGHAFARYQDANNHWHCTQTMVRTPCETLVHDVLIREDTFETVRPTMQVYSDHRDVDPALVNRNCDLLPMAETINHLGRGPSVLTTPDVPRYSEMAQYALERAGWDGSRFDVYRCRVEFPVMPSSVVMTFDLPLDPSLAAG